VGVGVSRPGLKQWYVVKKKFKQLLEGICKIKISFLIHTTEGQVGSALIWAPMQKSIFTTDLVFCTSWPSRWWWGEGPETVLMSHHLGGSVSFCCFPALSSSEAGDGSSFLPKININKMTETGVKPWLHIIQYFKMKLLAKLLC
jgi:hypothetical protein